MRRIGNALAAAIAFFIGSAGQAAQPSRDMVRAQSLYRAACASCHDQRATGAPTRSALQTRTPEAIVSALTSGLMREQGRSLKVADRLLIANYLGSRAKAAVGNNCQGRLVAGRVLWNRWGNGLDNRRYQTAAKGGITPATLDNLELKWAFGFPGAARARSQPAVSEKAIFTGSQDGRVYALDAQTGCVWWSFAADAEVRNAPTLGLDRKGDAEVLYFGDFAATVYAVGANDGRLIWKSSVKDHPAGTITGSVTLQGDRLFVPMSSTEVVSAMDGRYGCCTFRGGVTALDARDGRKLWRTYTTDAAQPQGKNAIGTQNYGPSGAPVWSAPTFDAKRDLIYVGSGENYSSPANDKSDAIIAIEAATGKIRWVTQVLAGDAWNASCGRSGANHNCPTEDGPDLDFGAPPILVQRPNGEDILLAGQKSGRVFGIAPVSGRIVWEQRMGAGGFNGGVHWGMASDGTVLYVPIADTPGGKAPVGPHRPGLYALDVATGREVWSRSEPNTCNKRAFECETALSAPVTLTDGLIFAGAHNGLLRAYSTSDGRLLWSFDTRRDFATVNKVAAHGGTIDSAGPVLAGGRLIVNSGYDKFGEIPGNVLLVFGPKTKKAKP